MVSAAKGVRTGDSLCRSLGHMLVNLYVASASICPKRRVREAQNTAASVLNEGCFSRKDLKKVVSIRLMADNEEAN